jgi:hypothetical protein
MPPRKAHTLWPNKGPLKKPRVVDTEKLLCGRSFCVCSIAARPMNVFLLCVSSLKLPESEAERAEAVVEEGETIRLGDGDDEKNWPCGGITCSKNRAMCRTLGPQWIMYRESHRSFPFLEPKRQTRPKLFFPDFFAK